MFGRSAPSRARHHKQEDVSTTQDDGKLTLFAYTPTRSSGMRRSSFPTHDKCPCRESPWRLNLMWPQNELGEMMDLNETEMMQTEEQGHWLRQKHSCFEQQTSIHDHVEQGYDSTRAQLCAHLIRVEENVLNRVERLQV